MSDSDRVALFGRWAGHWDDSEYYWAADEATDALAFANLPVTFEPVSACGGIFTICAQA